MSNDLHNARRSSPEEVGAVSVSSDIFHVVGTAETLLTRQDDAKILAMTVESASESFRIKPGDHRARTFDDADVTVGTDVVVLSNEFGGVHEFLPGDGPYYLTATVTLPAGLALLTLYFIEVVSTTEVAFHLSKANAVRADSATRVDITAAASGGVHTVAGVDVVTPAATTTDGQLGSWLFQAGTNQTPSVPATIMAPDRLTVVGSAAGAILTYFWV